MLKYLNVSYQKAILYFSFDYFFVLSLVRKRIINMGKVKLKVAIVGTRTPKLSYSEWEKLLLEEISPDDMSLIVSGGAAGIDTYAKLFAGRHHIRQRYGSDGDCRKALLTHEGIPVRR